MTARGIANHNPTNLVYMDANKWQGLSDPPSDGKFCRFDSPIYGIRAAAVNLLAYQDRHGFNTPAAIIGHWAPLSENDTNSYLSDVCQRAGFTADQELNLHAYDDMRPLIEAIIWHENGSQPYTQAQIDKALVLAGVEPPQKSMQASRTVRGSQVAAGAGAVATIAGTVAQIEPALPVIQFIHDNLNTISFGLILVGVAVLAGIAYVVYARLDDRRKGLR